MVLAQLAWREALHYIEVTLGVNASKPSRWLAAHRDWARVSRHHFRRPSHQRLQDGRCKRAELSALRNGRLLYERELREDENLVHPVHLCAHGHRQDGSLNSMPLYTLLQILSISVFEKTQRVAQHPTRNPVGRQPVEFFSF